MGIPYSASGALVSWDFVYAFLAYGRVFEKRKKNMHDDFTFATMYMLCHESPKFMIVLDLNHMFGKSTWPELGANPVASVWCLEGALRWGVSSFRSGHVMGKRRVGLMFGRRSPSVCTFGSLGRPTDRSGGGLVFLRRPLFGGMSVVRSGLLGSNLRGRCGVLGARPVGGCASGSVRPPRRI